MTYVSCLLGGWVSTYVSCLLGEWDSTFLPCSLKGAEHYNNPYG